MDESDPEERASERASTASSGSQTEQSVRANAIRLWGTDFAFVLAVLIGTYSMHRLWFVVEEGEEDRSVVVHSPVSEMKRPVLTFATVGGFNRPAEFPYGAMQPLRRRDSSPPDDDPREE